MFIEEDHFIPVVDRKVTWDRPAPLYHYEKKLCVCKGTGLVPPVLVEGLSQAYCPKHPIKRTWPQLQADGSIKRIPI